MKGKKGNPPNWNILVSGGKEINKDSVSKGDWNRKSLNRYEFEKIRDEGLMG